MFGGALEFLEEEREAWRPFEALDGLTDELLARPVEVAHGWSGRDLMGHLTAWQETAMAVPRRLAGLTLLPGGEAGSRRRSLNGAGRAST